MTATKSDPQESPRQLGGFDAGSGNAADGTTPARTDAAPDRAGTRVPVTRAELIGVIAITAAAALLRFAYAGSGGPWDSDQGSMVLAIWTAATTGQLPLYGPLSSLVGAPFYHGPLFYDLMVPAAWLSNGDPRVILFEIAAINALIVPMLWWIARSIGGRAGGLVVALMAATSADLVVFSTFIWNPTLVGPGAALGLLGTWQAWRTANPRWWLVAAVGFAVAVQAHETAAVLALPFGAAFVLDLRRTAPNFRRRVALWGLAGGLFVLATYSLVIYHEFTDGFPEIRGLSSYAGSSPGVTSVDPIARVVFAGIRIPAWPLTGWPYFELRPGVLLAIAVALAVAAAGSLLTLRTWRDRQTISGGEAPAADERHGIALIVGGLALSILSLGLGLHAVSELNRTMTEQYHMVADPFVLLVAAIAIGAMWQARSPGLARLGGRALASVLLVAFVGWNAAHWPPLTPAGNWTDAQAAATRIERDGAGGRIALVPLYQPKGTDAYLYPLARDGITLVEPDVASTIVLLCDSAWITTGCGGDEEDRWIRSRPDGQALQLVDRFVAGPDRTMSVYRRSQ